MWGGGSKRVTVYLKHFLCLCRASTQIECKQPAAVYLEGRAGPRLSRVGEPPALGAQRLRPGLGVRG